ncbi:MAG: helix-turn-helix domain-containing protein [Nibricoccus sp.]
MTTETATPASKFTFSERWDAELKRFGHVQVSSFFLENYHRLKPYDLTHGEAMFVIHLMQYKWSADAPYPAYKTLAQKMGVTHKTARRLAASLEAKGYLVREKRKNMTNRFHLKKLIDALLALKRGQPAAVAT